MQLLLPGFGNSSSAGLQGRAHTLPVTPGLPGSLLISQLLLPAGSSQRMEVSTGVMECSCCRDGSTSQQPFPSSFLLLSFLTRSEPKPDTISYSAGGKKITELGQVPGKTRTCGEAAATISSHTFPVTSAIERKFTKLRGKRGILAFYIQTS